MKRLITLALATLMAVSLLTACGGQQQKEPTPKSPEELAELYTSAIEGARDQELNDAFPVFTDPQDDMAEFIFAMLGQSADDMTAFAMAVSPMNIKAYGIALIRPAADKEQAVTDGLQAFIDNQKQSFEFYLEDQYDIAKSAKLETLSDGTVLMVMCDGQDEIFQSIKSAVEAG